MSMLSTNFTQETNTNTKEESKMKNLKEEMLNIYNLVNESRLSKEKKAEITNSLTAIKETLKTNMQRKRSHQETICIIY